jgi:hypothetical protein
MTTPSIRLHVLASVLIGLPDAVGAASQRILISIRPFRDRPWFSAHGSYRAAQKRRAARRIGTLADYAWYGSAKDWERVKALALAGREDLICPPKSRAAKTRNQLTSR